MDENKTQSDVDGEKATAKPVATKRAVAPTKASKSEAPKRTVEEETIPQSYVWLANGEVLRANDEDLPGHAGNAHPHGFWQKNGQVYTIVGIYPVEEKAAE